MKNFTQVPNELIRSRKKVSKNAILVYLEIASFNPSFPSYRRIQAETGLTRKSISKAIKELEALNIIVVSHRGAFRGNTNQYQVNPQEVWRLAGIPTEPVPSGNQSKRYPEGTSTGSLGTPAQVPTGYHNKIKEKDQINTNGNFDFEHLFQEYPKRKDGNMKKIQGIRECISKIKIQEQYDSCLLGIKNYARHIRIKQRTDSNGYEYIYSFYKFIAEEKWLEWPQLDEPEKREVIVCGRSEKKESDCPL